MKYKVKKLIAIFIYLIAVSFAFAGCSKSDMAPTSSFSNTSESSSSTVTLTTDESSDSNEFNLQSSSDIATEKSVLEVCFGDEGKPFSMNLYDNDTAKAIARHVGTADWRLPIYNFDDYENWEVMQYYDIPSRYEIPSNPEIITSAKAGDVYYSDPNRIVLFYQDGEVTGEYTKIGYFDSTDEFVSAVENNPVLEGWGNKIVLIGTSN